jgi:hypothetical protein
MKKCIITIVGPGDELHDKFVNELRKDSSAVNYNDSYLHCYDGITDDIGSIILTNNEITVIAFDHSENNHFDDCDWDDVIFVCSLDEALDRFIKAGGD